MKRPPTRRPFSQSGHWYIYAGTMNAQNIAIVGATGAVGVEILRVLERRGFPGASLKLLASAPPVGKTLEVKGKADPGEGLKGAAFKGVEIPLFQSRPRPHRR